MKNGSLPWQLPFFYVSRSFTPLLTKNNFILIIPRFEHTRTAVQRTLTAHWIICLNPLISSCSNHSALSMVKPYGGVKRPIDRAVRLEQMANKRIKAMC